MIVANLALARSINYDHKLCWKLKHTFTIINYDPKPFIVQATGYTSRVSVSIGDHLGKCQIDDSQLDPEFRAEWPENWAKIHPIYGNVAKTEAKILKLKLKVQNTYTQLLLMLR